LYEKENHLGNVHVVFTSALTDSVYFTDIEEENDIDFQRVESLREEIEIPQARSGSHVARLNAAEQLEDGSSRGIGPVLNLREVKEGERLRLSIWHYEEPVQASAEAPQNVNSNLWNNLQAPLFGISLRDKNDQEIRKWQGIHLNLLSVVPLLKNSKQRNLSKARNISGRTRPVFIGGDIDLSHLVVEKWSDEGQLIASEQYPLENLSPLAEEGKWVETTASYEIGECEGCSIKAYVQTIAERDLLIEDFEVVHEREQVKVVNTKSYYPFGSLLSYTEDSTLSTTANSRRNYQGNFAEWDEESSNYHFTLRLMDPVIGRWLSVDPYRQFYSPYVGMGNDPVNRIDPDGGISTSPVYDKNGNFLGTDSQGFMGEILIMEAADFTKGMDHDLAKSIGLGINNAGLSDMAASRIFTHILGTTMPEIDLGSLHNEMISIYNGRTGPQFNDGERAFGLANTAIKGLTGYKGNALPGTIKITANFSYKGKYTELNTVENVQSALGVHEYLGHGLWSYGDKKGNHHKAYELQFKHSSWKHTTKSFKSYMIDNYKHYKSYE